MEYKAICLSKMLGIDVFIETDANPTILRFPDPSYCPVGSVEFVREYMRACEIAEPAPLDYPEELTKYLYRKVARHASISTVGKHRFVKPVGTKSWTGGILRSLTIEPSMLDTPIWASDPVNFVCEWRCYVMHGQLLFASRYDDQDDDRPEPDFLSVKNMIIDYTQAPVAYTLDVGVLDSGETALVEVSDAWALGLYKPEPNAPRIALGNYQRAYAEMLWSRWNQLRNLP